MQPLLGRLPNGLTSNGLYHSIREPAFLEGAVDSTIDNTKVRKHALLLWPSLTKSLPAFARGKGLLTIGGGKNTMTGPSDFKCNQLKRCMVQSAAASNPNARKSA